MHLEHGSHCWARGAGNRGSCGLVGRGRPGLQSRSSFEFARPEGSALQKQDKEVSEPGWEAVGEGGEFSRKGQPHFSQAAAQGLGL